MHWYFPLHLILEYSTALKRRHPHLRIVVGGLTAGIYADYLLREAPIDFVLTGDTEAAFPRLVEGILTGVPEEQLASIPNTWSRLGPPRELVTIGPDAYDRLDFLTHDWFPSYANFVEQTHSNDDPESLDWNFDSNFPHIPLMRGCAYPCQFCYGHYQRFLFPHGHMFRTPAGVVRDLEWLHERGYRYVSFLNGMEMGQFLETNPFPRRYSMKASLMMCFLPSRQFLQTLVEHFPRVFIALSYPEDNLLFNRLQERERPLVDDFISTLEGFEDSGLEIMMSRVDFGSRDKRRFQDWLDREKPRHVHLFENYDWNLPRPRRVAYRGESLDAQFSRFRRYSREWLQYAAAIRLLPGQARLFRHWSPLRDYTSPEAGTTTPTEARLQGLLATTYQERFVPGFPLLEVELCYRAPLVGGQASGTAGFAHVTLSSADLVAPFERIPAAMCCDGPFASFTWERLPTGLSEFLLAARVGEHDSAEIIDLESLFEGWSVRLPIAADQRSTLRLEVLGNTVRVLLISDGELRWQAEVSSPVPFQQHMRPYEPESRTLSMMRHLRQHFAASAAQPPQVRELVGVVEIAPVDEDGASFVLRVEPRGDRKHYLVEGEWGMSYRALGQARNGQYPKLALAHLHRIVCQWRETSASRASEANENLISREE